MNAVNATGIAADIFVVIPTHNRAHTLSRALDSVYAQTLTPREIIVIDDGSDDDTPHLMRERHTDVVYLRQQNFGVSHARNRGIRRARGAWIALLDSDDAWLPDKLALQIDAMAQAGERPLCHCDEIWIRNGRRVNPRQKHRKRGGRIFRDCLPLCAISPSAALIRRSLFDDVGLFDESLPACEDYDLWLRVTARHRVRYVDDPLVIKHGGHDDQLSRRYWGMDRFRVQALEKIIAGQTLPVADYIAALQMLVQKIDVLLAGAAKRNNAAVLQRYSGKRAYYETLLHDASQAN